MVFEIMQSTGTATGIGSQPREKHDYIKKLAGIKIVLYRFSGRFRQTGGQFKRFLYMREIESS